MQTLKEIVEKAKPLEAYEQRSLSDEYLEFVIYNKDIEQWTKLLVAILGPAVKPAGAKPTKEQLKLTEDYGGVFENQTLFKKEFDGVTVVAMFWPWQDHTYTTLKAALCKNE